MCVEGKHSEEEISCKIAAMQMSALIDSGAAVNVVTEQQFESMLRNKDYKDNVSNVQKGPEIKLRAFAQATTLEVIATFMADLWITHDRPRFRGKIYESAKRYGILLVGLKSSSVRNLPN